MKFKVYASLIVGLASVYLGNTLQPPSFSENVAQTPYSTLQAAAINKPLISEKTEKYIKDLLTKWNSSGLSVAIVRKDEDLPTGWYHEFSTYGIAKADASPLTPDSVFAIASNSKLFLAFSVGLLISNKTLAKERGKEIKWSTKIRDLIPEWGLMDEHMDRGVTLQDMLSHRTGMPRHDFSGMHRKGGISEMISVMRYLRPSAEFRETFQYNNLMYETLSYLPQVLLNQTYESYVAQHLFNPLDMSASTFSVVEAEARGTLADGFRRDMQNLMKGKDGILTPVVPYFQRPGEEKIWAGAGGVLTSTRDLAVWVSMLLNDGRHPYTNESIIPPGVVEHVAYGRSIFSAKPEFPELSPNVYGAGQWQYSYQGHGLIEHNGATIGYKTSVTRFPNDNLGIIVLSNDGDFGYYIHESVKYHIAEEILGLQEVNWSSRYEKQWNDYVEKAQHITPRPAPPLSPNAPFTSLAKESFSHPSYGVLQPCLIPASVPFSSDALSEFSHCANLLSSSSVQRILGVSDLSIPTYIISWQGFFTTHLRLTHFNENLFNVTVIWSNAEVREKEGYSDGENGTKGDVLIGLDEHYEVEWVHGENGEEGLAFRGGFWGMGELDACSPGGVGKESAEVWFSRQ